MIPKVPLSERELSFDELQAKFTRATAIDMYTAYKDTLSVLIERDPYGDVQAMTDISMFVAQQWSNISVQQKLNAAYQAQLDMAKAMQRYPNEKMH